MEWLMDVVYFVSFPVILALAVLITYKGEANHYQIVKVTNGLGDEKFEVYFRYETMDFVSRNWRLEKTFDTKHEAEEFVAQQYTVRETVSKGKLTK